MLCREPCAYNLGYAVRNYVVPMSSNFRLLHDWSNVKKSTHISCCRKIASQYFRNMQCDCVTGAHNNSHKARDTMQIFPCVTVHPNTRYIHVCSYKRSINRQHELSAFGKRRRRTVPLQHEGCIIPYTKKLRNPAIAFRSCQVVGHICNAHL